MLARWFGRVGGFVVKWVIGLWVCVASLALSGWGLDCRVDEIYYSIVRGQITQSEYSHEIGTWPTLVTAEKLKIMPIEETNFFMPLQTVLTLHRVNRSYALQGLNAIDEQLLLTARRYVQDTRDSRRTRGSVSFWPYKRMPDGSYKHHFANDQALYDLFAQVDLANDMDTSSRLARWFSEIALKDDEFIDGFVHMALDNTSPENGAFMTWVHNDGATLANNTDCVVNMNVLGSLSTIFQSYPRSTRGDAVMASACSFVNRSIAEQGMPQCSFYYDRFLEGALAFAQAIDDGAECLKVSVPTVMHELLAKADAMKESTLVNTTHLAELIVSLATLSSTTGTTPKIENTVASLRAQLIENISQRDIIGTSVFIGTFPSDTFHWQSKAYSQAVVLEALTTP